jgi:hypothetical protein
MEHFVGVASSARHASSALRSPTKIVKAREASRIFVG